MGLSALSGGDGGLTAPEVASVLVQKVLGESVDSEHLLLPGSGSRTSGGTAAGGWFCF